MTMKQNLVCNFCKKTFERENKTINGQKKKGFLNIYCSIKCKNSEQFKNHLSLLKCKNCTYNINKLLSEIKKSKSGNLFCSQSCAAIYNNTHKTKGIRVSKLEIYIQTKLKEIYPGLEFLFNQTDTINSELDIYIPSLKLAFEINGIFHYEPIYGQEKLNKIQNNDNRKFQACLEKQIELCIIDASNIIYFKQNNAIKYFDIINDLIVLKLKSLPS